MTAHRRTPLQFCGQATVASNDHISNSDDKNGMAFVHKLVSFDDERDVLIDTMDGIIAACSHAANDDDDDARMPRQCRQCLDRPPGRIAPRPRSSERSSYEDVAPSSLFGRRCYVNVEEMYHIDPRIIGSGQHGSVRRCVERSTGEYYAIKSKRKDDPCVSPRGIVREVELLRCTNHENIIRLFDVFEDDEYVHLVTDLCVGGELFDRIVERSPSSDVGDDHDDVPCFGENEAARVVYQILDAISHMHDGGIVHRDIKPENVLFVTSDECSPIKLIDLGLSRRHDGIVDAPMSSLVGTPYYIAPEVLRRRGYDRSCDLWSIGVVTYILLCGYPPFNGATDRRTYESILRGKYAFHPEDWRNVSVDAMDFVRGLLQVDPGRRMTARHALGHPWMVKRARCTMDVVLD